jgi:hypothetical protein
VLRGHKSRTYSKAQSSEEISAFQKCRRGPRYGFIGGIKDEAFEYLENPLI